MSVELVSLTDAFNARAAREGWPTRCDAQLAFDSPALAALLGIWQGARGARPLPMRGDLTARMLARHLNNLALVELVPGEDGGRRYRFRLYGSGLARYSGDCTGKFLEEVIPERALPSWCATFDAPLATRTPLRFVSQLTAFKLDYMTAESLIAPLGDAQGAPSGLLISVTYTPRVP